MNKKNKGLMLGLAAIAALALSTCSAFAVTGAAFTTVNETVDGTGHCQNGNPNVNCNIYDGKQYVWLNGGPSVAYVGDGTYFFAVLEPGGQADPNDGAGKNLSDLPGGDLYANRTFTVTGGVVSYSGTHDFDVNKIRLMPYDDTTNPGGVYILAICYLGPVGGPLSYPVDPRKCKYDAFKIKEAEPCTPTLTISCPTVASQVCTHLNGTCQEVTYDDPTTDGAQGEVSVICTPPSESCFDVGSTEVRCIATDDCSAIDCTFQVDVQACPVCHLKCLTPNPVCTAVGDTSCSATVLWTPPSCETAEGITVVCTDDKARTVSGGESYPVGTTAVTCVGYDSSGQPAVDVKGNPVSCSFDVVVNDCTPPSINCPTVAPVCAGTSCQVAVPFSPTFSDNCASQKTLAASLAW